MKPPPTAPKIVLKKVGARKVRVVEPPANRPSLWRRFRLLMLVVQVVAAAALIEAFLIRPRYHKRESEPTPTATKPAPTVAVPGQPAPFPAADRERRLPHLTPVGEAQLPDPRDLAPGSREAQERQVAFSLRSGLPLEVENSIGIRFRLIPPGTCLVGSPPAEPGRSSWETRHQAWFNRPLYVSVSEITQEQWLKIMPENPSWFRSAARPVEEITWHQAVEFAQKLNAKEGLPANCYRLPTEREWEYACRAGTDTAFYFGDDPRQLRRYADYQENNHRNPNFGRQRLPNAFGLHDMLGNVWEWCIDRFDRYERADENAPYEVLINLKPTSELDDPAISRSIRGGNWLALPLDCRAASRGRLPPASHGNMLGLRLVRTVPEFTASGQEKSTPPDWLRPAAP